VIRIFCVLFSQDPRKCEYIPNVVQLEDLKLEDRGNTAGDDTHAVERLITSKIAFFAHRL
jgi:hypothetical protein